MTFAARKKKDYKDLSAFNSDDFELPKPGETCFLWSPNRQQENSNPGITYFVEEEPDSPEEGIIDIKNYLENRARDRAAMLTQVTNLRNLEYNWDGRGAYPLSDGTVSMAEEFFARILPLLMKSDSLPEEIAPGAGDFIEFVWSKNNTRLEIWIYGEDGFEAEYSIESGERVLKEDSTDSLQVVESLIYDYLSDC